MNNNQVVSRVFRVFISAMAIQIAVIIEIMAIQAAISTAFTCLTHIISFILIVKAILIQLIKD